MRRERSGDEGVRIHASLAEFFSLSLGACSQANLRKLWRMSR